MKKLFILPLMVVGNILQAQQLTDSIAILELNPVTIIGTSAHLIPGSGQYISSKTLDQLNQPNINHVLRTIPGINIRDEEGFGLRPNIGLRGTSVNRSAKITLMEDGILIAPAPYADPEAYYFPTFLRIQAVEVLKGSSQIKYGPYTVGGAVNLISTEIPTSFKGFAQVSAGSFGTNQQRVWVGDSKQNIDYVFDVNRIASNGFKQLENEESTGFERTDLMAKLRWHNHEKATMKQSILMKIINLEEIGNETYLGLTYEDFKANPLRRYAATQKDLLNMKHNHISFLHTIRPTKNSVIHTTFYFSKTYRDWGRVNSIGGNSINNILGNPNLFATSYQIMTGQSNGNIEYQNASRTYISKGIQTNAQLRYITGKVNHTLQIGIRVHSDQSDRYGTGSTYTINNGKMILTSVSVKGNKENQIRKATAMAAYLKYDMEYKGLKITPGVRFEHIEFNFQNFGNNDNGRLGTGLSFATNTMNIILPGIGFNYAFYNGSDVFAGIHKGFSPPGMPSINSIREQAKVETAINYELGYRYDQNGLQVQAAAFLNEYAQILGSDNMSAGGLGTGDKFNAGHATVKGIELSIGYNILETLVARNKTKLKLPLHIAYTYTNAQFKETFINGGGDWGTGTIYKGNLIPFITPYLLTVSLGIEHNKLNTMLIARYVGETRTKPSNEPTIVPANNIGYNSVNALKSFLMIDWSTNYLFTKRCTLFLNINNVTNNKAIVANLPNGYRPNMPIGFNIGLKAHL